jgi:hypothetical protein
LRAARGGAERAGAGGVLAMCFDAAPDPGALAAPRPEPPSAPSTRYASTHSLCPRASGDAKHTINPTIAA